MFLRGRPQCRFKVVLTDGEASLLSHSELGQSLMTGALTSADSLGLENFYFFEQLINLPVSILVVFEFLYFRESLRYIEIQLIRKRSLHLRSVARQSRLLERRAQRMSSRCRRLALPQPSWWRAVFAVGLDFSLNLLIPTIKLLHLDK